MPYLTALNLPNFRLETCREPQHVDLPLLYSTVTARACTMTVAIPPPPLILSVGVTLHT